MRDMPNEAIVLYLKGNKEKFPRDVLIGQLKQSGYPETEIAEGVSIVYDGVPVPAPESRRFFDFKPVRAYRTSGEKTADALFGFFVPILLSLIPFVGFFVDIFFLIYFWSRRRFIAYGVLIRLATGAIAFGVIFVLILRESNDFFPWGRLF